MVAITKGMIRTNAIAALQGGVSVKRVREFLYENGLQLVAWENAGGRNYMAVEPAEDLKGIEYTPEKVNRQDFIKVLAEETVVEI